MESSPAAAILGFSHGRISDSVRWSVTLSLALLWSLGIAILVTLFAFDNAATQNDNSSRVRSRILSSEVLLKELELDLTLRAFADRQAHFVDPDRAAKTISENLSEAEKLATTPEQKARIEELKNQSTQKLMLLEKSRELLQRGEVEKARQNLVSSEDLRLTGSLDQSSDVIVQAERDYLQNTRESVDSLANVLKAMSIVGVLLLTAFKLAWLRTIQARLAPLSACVERAREIARNEFFQDPLDISQEDEVGRLTRAINEMTKSLAAGASTVSEAQISVTQTASALSQGVTEQVSALTQLSVGIQEIRATLQQLNTSSLQNSERINSLANKGVERDKAAQSGLQAVAENSRAAQAMQSRVSEVSQITTELSEKARKIERIVLFVNEMAERSNILSINSALLAATTQGNDDDSFSVLAEEMQKLTARSKKATLEIQETVQSVRGEIERVVRATAAATQEVEAGSRTAQKASRAFEALKEGISENNDAFLEIVDSIRSQNIALADVEEALISMSQSAVLVEEESRGLEEEASLLRDLNRRLEDTELLRAIRGQVVHP